MANRVAQLARLTAERNWKQWGDRQIRTRTATQERLDSNGVYVGYTAERECHQIRLFSGAVVDAESITNAGLSAGDRVTVSYGSTIRFKAMPR